MTQRVSLTLLSLTLLAGSGVGGVAQVYCEPPSIDVELGDAELRTDQNFTCAYNSRVCPIVYADLNNDGVRNPGETVYRGVEAQLTNEAETTVIYTEITDNGENACFAPLTDGETYRVRIPNGSGGSGTNWPSPIMTTDGYDPSFPNIQEFDITTDSGTQLALFGFSPGGITLDVPESVSFGTINTESETQTVETIVNPVEVEDTRGAITNWSVTGTVTDFVSTDTLSTIPVADAFTHTPGTISIQNGSANGITAGNAYTVTSPSDPFTVFQGTTDNGTGLFAIESEIELAVPAFTPAKDYTATITYTLIN